MDFLEGSDNGDINGYGELGKFTKIEKQILSGEIDFVEMWKECSNAPGYVSPHTHVSELQTEGGTNEKYNEELKKDDGLRTSVSNFRKPDAKDGIYWTWDMFLHARKYPPPCVVGYYVQNAMDVLYDMEFLISLRIMKNRTKNVGKTATTKLYLRVPSHTFDIVVTRMANECPVDKESVKNVRIKCGIKKIPSKLYTFEWRGEKKKKMPNIYTSIWNTQQDKGYFGFLHRMLVYYLKLEYYKELNLMFLSFKYVVGKWNGVCWIEK